MNTLKSDSLGKILSKTRKSLNLSQQDIANKLCLKINIIRDIENDKKTKNISSVFFNGYINSYIRLLNLSEKYLFNSVKKCEVDDSGILNSELKDNNIGKKIVNFIYINIMYIIKLLFLISINFFYFYYII